MNVPYYAPPPPQDRGCFSLSCGCCSGGCLVGVLLVALFTILFAYGYKVGVVRHPSEFAYIHVLSEEMSPTLQPGDWVLVDRSYYSREEVERGDVVWIAASGERAEESKRFLRVAGLAGESVSFDASGELQINGSTFTRHPMLSERDFRLDQKPPDPVALEGDEVYLVGDNRGEAKDSRVSGPFARKGVHGRAVSILFPPNRVGRLDQD